MHHLQKPVVSSYRRRQRRRAAITLSLVGLAMVGTFAYAAAYFQGWVATGAPKPLASQACQAVTPAQELILSAFTINVYNATNRDGLARSVAKSLRTQGFKVGEVANDPLGKKVGGVGEVRHGQSGEAGATLAAMRLSGAKVLLDKRTDDTVDLVLGNAFTALHAPPEVVQANASRPRVSTTKPC